MNKDKLIEKLNENHALFVAYVDSLSEDEYLYRNQDSWSGEEQLAHIALCIKPLAHVLNLPTTVIEQQFGKTNRSNRSYEELLAMYLEQLKNGGKAPEPYVPNEDVSLKKERLVTAISESLNQINSAIIKMTTEELETLLIPHPLLGKITIKEMLYNACYHVEHHHNKLKESLK